MTRASFLRCLLLAGACALPSCHRNAPAPRPLMTRWVYAVVRGKNGTRGDPAQEMSATAHALELRAALIGIQGARVLAGKDEIFVDLPAIDAPTAARLEQLFARRGVLEFLPVVDDVPPSTALTDAAERDKSEVADEVHVATEPWFAPGTHKEHKLPHLEAENRESLETVLEEIGADKLVAPFTVAIGEAAPANGIGGPRWRTWVLDRRSGLVDPDVEHAEAQTSKTVSQPQVTVEFAPDTAKRFADLTKKLVGHKLAIVVDDEVESAPIVQEPILSGKAVVSMGRDTPKDATDLAVILGSGRLPYAIERKSIIDRHTGKPPAGT